MRVRVPVPGHSDGVNESAHVALTLRQLEQDIQKLARIVAEQSEKHRDEDRATGATTDAVWQCRKCSYLLGFYDIRSEVLRVRYKEHLMYVRVGLGGFVQVFCRSCGEANTQEFVAQDANRGERH